MSTTQKLRLDRLLANLGYGSRREVRALIKQGLVTLEDSPLTDPDQRFTIDDHLSLHLKIDGEALDPLPGMVLMMNKPTGLSCSRREAGGIVYELLPERWQRRDPPLSTVGRLDKETSGLLLFTDDGSLLHKITAPKKEISKHYRAELETPLRGDEEKIFSSGTLMLQGEDSPLLPATLIVHSPTSVTVGIKEGRYHQVRRMFTAVGNSVVALHRISIGSLFLDNLEEGEFRILKKEDLDLVFAPPPPML